MSGAEKREEKIVAYDTKISGERGGGGAPTGSPARLESILEPFAKAVGALVSEPDPKIAELRERMNEAGLPAEAMRSLDAAEKTSLRARQKAAATSISVALKPHGVILHPGVPLKRMRKAKPKPAGPAVEKPPEDLPELESVKEPDGGEEKTPLLRKVFGS